MRGWRGLRICWCRLRRRLWGRLCRGRLRLEEVVEEEEEENIFLFSESPFHISSACLLAAASQRKTSLIQGPFLSLRQKRNPFTPRGYPLATKVWSKREKRRKKKEIPGSQAPPPPPPPPPSESLDIVVSIFTSQESRGYAQSPSGINIQKKEKPPPWILGL